MDFQGIGLRRRAILVWRTAAELETLGFNLFRAASTEGPWTQINRNLVPALGGTASGGSYTLSDVPGEGTWHYRLEVVGAGGEGSLHSGPIVRVGANAEGWEIFLPGLRAQQESPTPVAALNRTIETAPSGLLARIRRWLGQP